MKVESTAKRSRGAFCNTFDLHQATFGFEIDAFSCPLGSWVSLWNFETIRGPLMRSKWQKLASLAQKICTL